MAIRSKNLGGAGDLTEPTCKEIRRFPHRSDRTAHSSVGAEAPARQSRI